MVAVQLFWNIFEIRIFTLFSFDFIMINAHFLEIFSFCNDILSLIITMTHVCDSAARAIKISLGAAFSLLSVKRYLPLLVQM